MKREHAGADAFELAGGVCAGLRILNMMQIKNRRQGTP
jgi:hypothetical protein